MSLNVFGKSHDSAFSSPYHFFHYIASYSIDVIRFSKILTYSRPLHAAQFVSGMNVRASVYFGGSRATTLLTNASTSFESIRPLERLILNVNIVAMVSL